MTEGTTFAKRYTLTGTIANPVVRQDKHGNDWVAFELKREGKKALKCVAFRARAEALIKNFADGAVAKLWGFYETNTFKGQDGQERSQQRFNLLSIKDPKKVEEQAAPAAA